MQYISDNHDHNKPMSPSMEGPHQQGHSGIKVTLLNTDLWKSFHGAGTEMIITKHGRRMFPHCNISLSGLDRYANYVIMVDMIPVDKFRYKWNKEQWEVAGKSEPQPPCRTYIHPESPAPGSYWMKQPLSFLKLKLTNNTLDQHGHIILHSMHRYHPRFHVIQADSPYTVRWGRFLTFSFPETHFTAVTAYHNVKITKLKIDHNPFAKGFREGGTHFHGKRCRSRKTLNNAEETATVDKEDTLCESPTDLQGALSVTKPRKRLCSDGHLSPWSVEQDQSESLHTEVLDLHGQDLSCEEQMVPASRAYQPYRYAEYGHPSPYSEVDDGDRLGCHDSRLPDVATVPDQHLSIRDGMTQQQQHHAAAQNQAAESSQGSRPPPVNMGLQGGYPLYSHWPYQVEQSAGSPGEAGACRQYMMNSLAHTPPARFHSAADHRAAQHGYHHHGSAAEWSQYPLFSYSSW